MRPKAPAQRFGYHCRLLCSLHINSLVEVSWNCLVRASSAGLPGQTVNRTFSIRTFFLLSLSSSWSSPASIYRASIYLFLFPCRFAGSAWRTCYSVLVLFTIIFAVLFLNKAISFGFLHFGWMNCFPLFQKYCAFFVRLFVNSRWGSSFLFFQSY